MKTVVITGGTRGIGEACVRLFSENNYKVFFIYRKEHEKARTLEKQTGATGFCADIQSNEECDRVISAITNKCNGIDVLINNAGIAEQKLFVDIMPDEWQRMIDTDLNGVYNITQPVLKNMLSKNDGVIINISSIWGQCGAACEVHYSTAKAGVIGFTKALAKEMGLSGIRVNCVAPGMIDTEMNNQLSNEDKNEICAQIPLGRMGKAAECAELILFLASNEATYITGQTIGINGGWKM